MKIIKQQGKSKLVEVESGERFVLPLGEGDVSLGIPYGISWEDITSPSVANELHRHNVYTYDDLYKRSDLAQTLLSLGQDYYQLLTLTKNYGGN